MTELEELLGAAAVTAAPSKPVATFLVDGARLLTVRLAEPLLTLGLAIVHLFQTTTKTTNTNLVYNMKRRSR